MTNKSEALGYAYELRFRWDRLGKSQRMEAVNMLLDYEFNTWHVAQITGLAMLTVRKWGEGHGSERGPRSMFGVRTLDSLYFLATRYEKDRAINATLTKKVIKWGTSLAQISYLTGIPLQELRDAIYVQ